MNEVSPIAPEAQSRSARLLSLALYLTIFIVGLDFVFTSLLSEDARIVYSDLVSVFLDAVVTVILLVAARLSANHSRRLGVAWGMIALAVLAFLLGDLSWTILELALHEPPFPSIADLFYILYYPLLLTGVLLLPGKPDTKEERIKKILDAGVVLVASFLGFWNFLFGPIIAENAGYPLLEQVILLAYPVADFVLLWAVLRIFFMHAEQQPEDEAPAFLLSASLLVTIVGDTLFTYQSLMGTFESGGFVDIFWRLTILLTGVAGVSQLTAIQMFKSTGIFPRRLETVINRSRVVLPYISYVWLIAAYTLLVRSRFAPLPMDFFSLSLAVGGIICLVLLRQMVTMAENKRLNTEIQQALGRLQVQASQLEKTNENLQNEIAERKIVEEQLTHDSLHDAMTGLPNRVLLLDRLGQAVEYCKRRPEYSFGLLFIDLDHFKVINDSLGHLTGDKVLIAIGKRMKSCLRASDTVARLGGDEFAVLLEITGEKDTAIVIAEKLQEAIRMPLQVEGHELYTSASIGIITDIAGYSNPEEALRDADIAMYQAKGSGKARFEVFDIHMRSQAFSRLELEQELRAALDHRQFELYFQPILSLESDRLVSFEALVRWNHPKRGLLPPEEFIWIAEESGLILPLGLWVLNEACTQLRQWHEAYPEFREVSISVNVSYRQFSQPDFVPQIVAALQLNRLKPGFLRLEITESVLINNHVVANEIFTQLRDMGIQLQVDDFGSGYSNLSYLQHFPISAVKIDKSFIHEMQKGHKGVELIRAIVSMARELGLQAIAEGIETGEQLDQLKQLLCTFGQGFLLSKPLDRDAVEKILANELPIDAV